jgi:hypothetical protein
MRFRHMIIQIIGKADLYSGHSDKFNLIIIINYDIMILLVKQKGGVRSSLLLQFPKILHRLLQQHTRTKTMAIQVLKEKNRIDIITGVRSIIITIIYESK